MQNSFQQGTCSITRGHALGDAGRDFASSHIKWILRNSAVKLLKHDLGLQVVLLV